MLVTCVFVIETAVLSTIASQTYEVDGLPEANRLAAMDVGRMAVQQNETYDTESFRIEGGFSCGGDGEWEDAYVNVGLTYDEAFARE